MQYRAFVDQVRRRALLEEEDEAVNAIGATLETLAGRIAAGEARDLAAQLPPEIGRYLHNVDSSESFELAEFYERVARREDVETVDAAYHARVVISVVHQAVASSTMAQLRAELPEAFDHLFAFVGKGDHEIGSATSRDDYW